MPKESTKLPWATPARYVGPAMVVLMLAGIAVAFWFASDQQFDQAIITLLITACFLLVGLADLLAEVIGLLRQDGDPTG